MQKVMALVAQRPMNTEPIHTREFRVAVITLNAQSNVAIAASRFDLRSTRRGINNTIHAQPRGVSKRVSAHRYPEQLQGLAAHFVLKSSQLDRVLVQLGSCQSLQRHFTFRGKGYQTGSGAAVPSRRTIQLSCLLRLSSVRHTPGAWRLCVFAAAHGVYPKTAEEETDEPQDPETPPNQT